MIISEEIHGGEGFRQWIPREEGSGSESPGRRVQAVNLREEGSGSEHVFYFWGEGVGDGEPAPPIPLLLRTGYCNMWKYYDVIFRLSVMNLHSSKVFKTVHRQTNRQTDGQTDTGMTSTILHQPILGRG